MKKRLLAVLLIAGCFKSTEHASPGPSLVADVKKALAEREQRLTSFSLVVDTTEGENTAQHTFAFRSPNKSRGHLLSPQNVELAFDGNTFVRLLHDKQKFSISKLQMSASERAYFLASTFMPFVPEGFRSPLLPNSGVDAKEVKRPDASQAVELSVKPGSDVVVTYVLRLPAGDFLEKRTALEGETRVLRVVNEECEAELRLCVPTKLVETLNGELLGTTTVSSIQLNSSFPIDFFSIHPPKAWTEMELPRVR